MAHLCGGVVTVHRGFGRVGHNIVGHLLDGVTDVDRDLGERIERGVRAG
jgi:hypothetical protein